MEFLKSLHRMYFTMKLLANYNESSIEMAFKNVHGDWSMSSRKKCV